VTSSNIGSVSLMSS